MIVDEARPAAPKQESVRAKILPPLVTAICLLQAIFLGVFWRQQATDMAAVEAVTAQRVQDLLQEEMQSDIAKMDTAMEVLIRDAELAEALAALDRARLSAIAMPIFQQFRSEHQITHFYFHRPNRVNLLRLHKALKGDLINRSTIQTAEQTGQPSAGLEQGPTGNPVLRLVYPWRSGFADTTASDLFTPPRRGELLGYLELGIEFEDISRRIHEILDVELILAVDKAYLDRQRWAGRNQKLGRQSDWEAYSNHVIVDQTVAAIPAAVADNIDRLDAAVTDTGRLRISENGQTYQVLFLPFNDIDNRELGYVIALKNISADVQQVRQTVLLAIISTVGIGASLVGFFYAFIGRVERNLNERTHKLALTTEALAHSKAELEAYSQTLEQKVEDRTQALRSNNQTLQETLSTLKATQAKLIQTEKMSSLGRFVAGIAHEINNPISFITGNIQHVQNYLEDLFKLLALYRQACPNPAAELQTALAEADIEFLQQDLPKTVQSIQTGSDRIRDIVLSLRKFSRLDEASYKAVSLHENLDSVLLLLQSRLQATPQRPEIQVQKDYEALPSIDCYASQLNQVLMHLITNAIDALDRWESGESDRAVPTLALRTTCQDGCIIVQVADNGPGISSAVQQQIFDPFFTTKPVGQGTGLGLTVSYQIIHEQHGGRLTCESTLGHGSVFTIEMPICQPKVPSWVPQA
ncbi:MAG: hypothetical protein F6J97_09295 [Leptolyngbya sp. SIO4C1]|nr:hypothetical protein [Leptolyngbya sp. SIO4C1]